MLQKWWQKMNLKVKCIQMSSVLKVGLNAAIHLRAKKTQKQCNLL